MLLLNNQLPISLTDIYVEIVSAPDWLIFKNKSSKIDSLSTNKFQSIEFEFDVLNTAAGLNDIIQIKIESPNNQYKRIKEVTFHTFMQQDESSIDCVYPNPVKLISIVLIAGIISGIILTLLTISIIYLVFKRGYDPDNITGPALATFGDVITMLCIFGSAVLVEVIL